MRGGDGENRGEPVRSQWGGLAPAPVGGRATVAAQHARGRCPGGVWLAGELGPKPDGGDGEGGGCGQLKAASSGGRSCRHTAETKLDWNGSNPPSTARAATCAR